MPQPDEGSSGAVYLFNAPQAEAKEILADDNFKSLDITFRNDFELVRLIPSIP